MQHLILENASGGVESLLQIGIYISCVGGYPVLVTNNDFKLDI